MSEQCEHEWMAINDLEEECVICGEIKRDPEYYKIFGRDSDE